MKGHISSLESKKKSILLTGWICVPAHGRASAPRWSEQLLHWMVRVHHFIITGKNNNFICWYTLHVSSGQSIAFIARSWGTAGKDISGHVEYFDFTSWWRSCRALFLMYLKAKLRMTVGCHNNFKTKIKPAKRKAILDMCCRALTLRCACNNRLCVFVSVPALFLCLYQSVMKPLLVFLAVL